MAEKRKRPLIELPLKAKLLSTAGEVLLEYQLPIVEKPPEIILWGDRVFLRKSIVTVTVGCAGPDPVPDTSPSVFDTAPELTGSGPDWSEGPEPEEEHVDEQVQYEATYGEVVAYRIPGVKTEQDAINAEREACAALCDEIKVEHMGPTLEQMARAKVARQCADAIRERETS